MDDSKQLWRIWQQLLSWFSSAFTRPGWVRFVQWVTGTVLCDEEHTITQEATALDSILQWRNWEHFAEYGSFDLRPTESALMALVEQEHPCRFGRYHPAAVDDTKALRSSRDVWGVCTFKHLSSRNAKNPKLVTAHNWVIMGDLAPGSGREPWTYLPTASRLYMRQSQLPAGETFHTKLEMAVAMLRQLDAASAAPVLGIFDGGYAWTNVVQPCLGVAAKPAAGRRIDVLTRPRCDARLYKPLADRKGPRRRGRPPKWGARLAAPQRHDKWNVPWKQGVAWAYGQMRSFRYKAVDCRWRMSGPDVPVRVFVFEVEGYTQPWFIVTSALDLTAEQVIEAYAARFRQEDGIRDHKQRLGMEEVRAWTKLPVLRTFLIQSLSITLMRLTQWKWEELRGDAWWEAPPWNRHKMRPSLLDVRRLFWKCRSAFSHFVRQMDEVTKNRPAAAA